MQSTHELLTDIYAAFNARDIDRVLAVMHPDVDWPNGWEGGRMHGREAVREYWTRQWAEIDPRVEPAGFAEDEHGRTVVAVKSLIRDRDGNVLFDGLLHHAYTFEDGLVRRMEIEQA